MRLSRTPAGRRAAAIVLAGVLASGLVACSEASTGSDPEPVQPTTEETEGTVRQHETSTESPLGYGLSVPDGATQLGPLVRRRSARLIEAYQPALEEARAEREAEEARRRAEEGEPSPTTPTSPTPPEPSPSRDSFIELDEPVPADLTTALMRVDGEPGEVFAEVLAQLDAVLPQNDIDPESWSSYCEATDAVFTGCTMTTEGTTTDDAQLRATVTLDPGDVTTRTAPPGAQGRPVMTVTLQNTADPTQIEPDDPTPSTPPPPPQTPSVPPAVEGAFVEPSTTAPSTAGSPLLNDVWTVRSDTTLLLSGYRPGFAIMIADRDIDADAVAKSYVLPFSDAGAPTQDIVEDRNEITTTYTAVSSKRGQQVVASYVQSGRGNYVVLSFVPATG